MALQAECVAATENSLVGFHPVLVSDQSQGAFTDYKGTERSSCVEALSITSSIIGFLFIVGQIVVTSVTLDKAPQTGYVGFWAGVSYLFTGIYVLYKNRWASDKKGKCFLVIVIATLVLSSIITAIYPLGFLIFFIVVLVGSQNSVAVLTFVSLCWILSIVEMVITIIMISIEKECCCYTKKAQAPIQQFIINQSNGGQTTELHVPPGHQAFSFDNFHSNNSNLSPNFARPVSSNYDYIEDPPSYETLSDNRVGAQAEGYQHLRENNSSHDSYLVPISEVDLSPQFNNNEDKDGYILPQTKNNN